VNNTTTQPIKILSNENSVQAKLMRPTQAIDIPTASSSCTASNASAVTSTITNDSLASSGGSSISIGNNNTNNSFSSTSVQSNYQQQQQSGQLQAAGSLPNTDLESKLNNLEKEKLVVASGSYNSKIEQDLFDEKLEKTAEQHDASQKQSNPVGSLDDDINPTNPVVVVQRRVSENPSSINQHHTRSIKRRYKSGLPLTTDRGDDDSVEEAYLRQYNAHANSKHSKDDMGLFYLFSYEATKISYQEHKHQLIKFYFRSEFKKGIYGNPNKAILLSIKMVSKNLSLICKIGNLNNLL
jgi:hypothetical protein